MKFIESRDITAPLLTTPKHLNDGLHSDLTNVRYYCIQQFDSSLSVLDLDSRHSIAFLQKTSASFIPKVVNRFDLNLAGCWDLIGLTFQSVILSCLIIFQGRESTQNFNIHWQIPCYDDKTLLNCIHWYHFEWPLISFWITLTFIQGQLYEKPETAAVNF